MPAADLSTSIATAAAAPKQVTVDGKTVIAHSLADQIEADRYLASKAAAKKKSRGLRFAKMSFPGAV